MNILFLDDSDERWLIFNKFTQGFKRVDFITTSSGAIQLLQSEQYDAIFLDYDLGKDGIEANEENGLKVAEWISANLSYQPKIVLHTGDLNGAEKMCHTLKQGGFKSNHTPFMELVATLHHIESLR
ncbi:hypothetical protein CCP3SC1_220026 [Gammaproteobacteria bacterium]